MITELPPSWCYRPSGTSLSPSGVRHTHKLPPYYTHSSCKRADDSVQRQLYKGKKPWGTCEMGQPRDRAITGETQACWRLPHWSNPRDGTTPVIYLYSQIGVRAFFYRCLYIIYVLFAALLCGTLLRKEELPLKCFPESRSICPPIYCRKGRGGWKKALCPAFGMDATLSLWTSCQPSPVIDSSVPLGSNAGICWP